MGLDMYLRKWPKVKGLNLWEIDYEDTEKNDPELHKRLEQYEVIHGDTSRFQAWIEYYEKVGYWRKANHIHKWFVDNVQGGTDDCNDYRISKEQIEALLERVNELLVGKRTAERADAILPTVDGFFFGGRAYDDYYWMQTKETKNLLEKVINETNWEKECITYRSSW